MEESLRGARRDPDTSGGGEGEDPGAGSVVDLSGGYSTAASQPIDFRVTGRAATANSADDITIVVDGLTTVFDAGSCDWTPNLDAGAASALWTESIGQFASSTARWFRMRVNLQANGQPDGEQFTIATHRDPRFGWEFKAGTPGDLLGSIHATGTFVDNGATRELTITGGAVRFTKADCGSECTVHTELFQVACPNADAFTATVTPG